MLLACFDQLMVINLLRQSTKTNVLIIDFVSSLCWSFKF